MKKQKRQAAPAFQFYPADFLVGTAHYTMEEVGAYIRLLCYQWEHNRIPIQPEKICRLAGAEKYSRIIDMVTEKFVQTSPGFLQNERLEQTRSEQQKHSAEQSERAKKRWENNTEVIPKSYRNYTENVPDESRNDTLHSTSSINKHSNTEGAEIEPSIFLETYTCIEYQNTMMKARSFPDLDFCIEQYNLARRADKNDPWPPELQHVPQELARFKKWVNSWSANSDKFNKLPNQTKHQHEKEGTGKIGRVTESDIANFVKGK